MARHGRDGHSPVALESMVSDIDKALGMIHEQESSLRLIARVSSHRTPCHDKKT